YLLKTPPGILEMLQIKGLGPKKIATIWKELDIETIGELLYACNENRLMLYKGFGEKTQQNVKEAIEFYLGSQGSYLYQQIELFAINVSQKLKLMFNSQYFWITGDFRKQATVIEKLDWVTTVSKEMFIDFFTKHQYQLVDETSNYVSFVGNENVTLGFYSVPKSMVFQQLFKTSCSDIFLQEWHAQFPDWELNTYASEEAIFQKHHVQFIIPAQRENDTIIHQAKQQALKKTIEVQEIRGIIHSHSTWSDGNDSLRDMAFAAKEKGYQYLVISDHSKTAAYAQGLQVERVLAQHNEIEALNKQLAPFKIFKSIESDILSDGSLDYEKDVLASFDIIIASVHSNLKMNEEKAMMRLLTAIENPYTSILGHLTGRLLLSRAGYPINHQKIIDACAAHNVVIELNAHPRRLDIDWKYIDYAMKKNVLISINPDAHAIEGFDDCKYGVLAAQKAGLTDKHNLSSFNLLEFELFVQAQKRKR
ncbi:MAG: DNA polymerase/3'-5' exonuclease PolX, partial [Chitinophagaceae bacterium]